MKIKSQLTALGTTEYFSSLSRIVFGLLLVLRVLEALPVLRLSLLLSPRRFRKLSTKEVPRDEPVLRAERGGAFCRAGGGV